MTQVVTQLSNKKIQEITQAESINNLSLEEIVTFFKQDLGESNLTGHQSLQYDPRNGEPVIFNPKRAHRPNGYIETQNINQQVSCPICAGQTTGILDVAKLSQGYTFINKNLYPVVTPIPQINKTIERKQRTANIIGLHFLQWTSSIHDRDWHNMPIEDCVVAMERLAALEKLLINSPKTLFNEKDKINQSPIENEWSVSIIKNVGDQIGGSLPHGHQQIIFSNVTPGRVVEHKKFKQEHGEPFSSFMLSHTLDNLIIKDYGDAVLLVPFFMRRPFDMMLILKNTDRMFLHEMGEQELQSTARGWHDGTFAITQVMPEIKRELAYNVITHNGQGAGLYFEFLPYTQETGGLEQLGLISCQADPIESARILRSVL